MVKVESKKILELVNVASLNGKIPSIVMNFKSDGVHIQSKDKENLSMITSFMKSESFDIYKEINIPVGIKNTAMLINILKSFGGVVNIEITNDLFTVYNEKKSASLKTGNAQHLSDYNLTVIPPVFDKFDAGVNMKSNIFKDTVKNMSIVGADEDKSVLINIENNLMSIKSGDKKFDTITEKEECVYHNVTGNYHEDLFKPAVSILPEDINFSLPILEGRSNAPLQFKFTSEDLVVRILISPNSVSPKVEKKEEPKIITGEVKKVTSDTKIDDLVDNNSDELL